MYMGHSLEIAAQCMVSMRQELLLFQFTSILHQGVAFAELFWRSPSPSPSATRSLLSIEARETETVYEKETVTTVAE